MFIFIFCSFDYARMLVPINIIFCIHHLQSSVAVVQLSSCVWLFVTPWTAACQSSLSLTISWSLPKFMFVASVMLSSQLILWRSLLLLPSIFPNEGKIFPLRDFSNELSVHVRWPKYWSFSFSIISSSEYSGLIFLKIDWFDLLVVQGTFRSLLQHTVRRHQLFGRPIRP